MKDIERDIFKIENRKDNATVWDDDVAVVFYKGNKIQATTFDRLSDVWRESQEETWTMEDLLKDITGIDFAIDPEDNNKLWEDIWDGLVYDKETNSYINGNWSVIILDL